MRICDFALRFCYNFALLKINKHYFGIDELVHGLDEICMPLGAEDDGYEVNASKGYPCGKAAQQRRNSGKIQKKGTQKARGAAAVRYI